MAFRFPLQTVLRIRRSLEQQEEALLVLINREIQAGISKLEKMDRAVSVLRDNRSSTVASGCTSAELSFFGDCINAVLRSRTRLHSKVDELRKLGALQRERFENCRRQREVVETLRSKQLAVYREQEMRKEQREIDDLFLVRRHSDRKG
jgi:flagellar export protein FliJ